MVPSSQDIHQDHRCLNEEAMRAFKHSTILGYELPWNMFSAELRCFIRLNNTHLQKKLEVLNCYKSQAQKIYTTTEFFRSLATVRGVQANAVFAEAYELIRIFL